MSMVIISLAGTLDFAIDMTLKRSTADRWKYSLAGSRSALVLMIDVRVLSCISGLLVKD